MSSPSFPQLFERILVPGIFRGWAEDLLDRVDLPANARILDLGCGTGVVARLVRERCGPAARISGVDVNPEMIAIAREAAPDIDWRAANALELPFPEGSFDLILTQQMLQFLPDRGAGIREMKRVLAPGGRAALSTWRSLEENPLYLALDQLAVARFGPHVDRRFSFGDDKALRALLSDAGFRDIKIDVVTRLDRLREPATFVGMNLAATADQLAEMSPEQRTRTIAEFQETARPVIAPFMAGNDLVYPSKANIAIARV